MVILSSGIPELEEIFMLFTAYNTIGPLTYQFKISNKEKIYSQYNLS